MTKISLAELKKTTGIGFGTSGIRGLITELTDKVCYVYTVAFIKHLENIKDISNDGAVALAGDLRESTDRIMLAVAKAISDCGYKVVNCGKIPAPAVAYFGIIKKMPSIMVTGSHIPSERNGIKYNLSTREVLKPDEEIISNSICDIDENLFDDSSMFKKDLLIDLPQLILEPQELYVQRYLDFFQKDLLKGKKIGLYGHSSVGKFIIQKILENLSAEVIPLEFTDYFLAIDSEVIGDDLVDKAKDWSKNFGLDAIVSTDGDSDRPLLADENGNWLRSDVLGIQTAKFLNSDAVVSTISSNTALEKIGWFKKILHTKIGSPYIIAGMTDLSNEGYKAVVGYEANGGFLTFSDIQNFKGLPTRDAVIVLLSWLSLSVSKNKTISQLADELPKRFTSSSSLKGFPTELSLKIIDDLIVGTFAEQKERIEKITNKFFGPIKEINTLDGLRITFENDDIVHFRPSKNSPEFRNYTEADNSERAIELSVLASKIISEWQAKGYEN